MRFITAAAAATAAIASSYTPSELLIAIRAAIAAGEPSFTVPPGLYNFTAAGTGPIVIQNAINFTLNAYGAEFVFPPGSGVALSNLTNVAIAGLTLDVSPLPFTQGVVANVVRTGDYVSYTLEIEDGYPALDAPYFVGVLSKTLFWDASSRTMFHAQVETTTDVHNATQVPGQNAWNIVSYMPERLLGNFTPPPGCLGTVSPVLSPAIACTPACTRVALTDVAVYASSAMGYVEAGGDGGNVLLRWSSVRRPNSTRLLATNLDGVHSTSMGEGLALIDSEVSFAADDLFAVHCELGIAWGVPSGASGGDVLYVIDTGGADARVITHARTGESLRFFALNETMDPLGLGTVLNITVVENATLQAQAARATSDIAHELGIVIRNVSGATLLLQVTFAAPLPAAVLPRFSSLVQYDGRCGFNTVVRNCSLHDTSGGMRLKGVNVTVQDVTLQRAYGMRMLPEVFWTQSTSANITIADNVFVTTGNAPSAPDSISYNNDTCPGLVLLNNTFLP